MRLLYTLFIGIPLCIFLMGLGCLFCVTIIGFPLGLTLFALGVKSLTLGPRRVVVVP